MNIASLEKRLKRAEVKLGKIELAMMTDEALAHRIIELAEALKPQLELGIAQHGSFQKACEAMKAPPADVELYRRVLDGSSQSEAQAVLDELVP